MADVIPLRIWYPAMADKWVARLDELNRQGVKIIYSLEERDGWTHHHTVGGEGRDAQAYARQVADQHWGQWRRPGGYNFLVGEDGRIREMCGLYHMGAHAGDNYWNRRTLGLAFQGDFRDAPPPDDMLAAASELIAETSIPDTQWTHRQVRPEPTSCPGDAFVRVLPLEADMALSDRDIERIWQYTIPDQDVAGERRGVAHGLKMAWRYGRIAAEQTSPKKISENVKRALIAAGGVGAGFGIDQLLEEAGRRLGGG